MLSPVTSGEVGCVELTARNGRHLLGPRPGTARRLPLRYRPRRNRRHHRPTAASHLEARREHPQTLIGVMLGPAKYS